MRCVSFTCVCAFCMSGCRCDKLTKSCCFDVLRKGVAHLFILTACISQVPFTESSDVKESGQRQVEKHVAELGLPWTSFR